MSNEAAEILRQIADDHDLLEVARRKVEDALVEFRDRRIGVLRNNGLVIKERNGDDSDVIRLTTENAVHIALLAIADTLEQEPPQ